MRDKFLSKKKVVITGLGVLAPNGNNINKFWESLCQGKSGINAITYFDTEGFSVKIAGELELPPNKKIFGFLV